MKNPRKCSSEQIIMFWMIRMSFNSILRPDGVHRAPSASIAHLRSPARTWRRPPRTWIWGRIVPDPPKHDFFNSRSFLSINNDNRSSRVHPCWIWAPNSSASQTYVQVRCHRRKSPKWEASGKALQNSKFESALIFFSGGVSQYPGNGW